MTIAKPPFESRVSRRNFMAAAGGATMAAALAEGAAKAADVTAWRHDTDVVVVGSGAAALSAAISAASEGKRVIIVEKAPVIGGTTSKSGGIWWLPNNHLLQRDAGIDPRDEAIAYMARGAFPARFNRKADHMGLEADEYALLETYYDKGPQILAEFDRMGALKQQYFKDYSGKPYVDYYTYSDGEEPRRGRSIAPDMGDGSPYGGAGLIKQLSQAAERLGATTLLSHRAVNIVRDDKGSVIGLVCDNEGETIHIRARRGVIFGTGGFTNNADFARNYLQGPIFGGCAVPTNTGDFLALAGTLGAELGNLTQAWWAQVVVEQALAFSSVPDDVFMLSGDSLVLVNRFGRRVVNEKAPYNERTQAHFEWDTKAKEYPNHVLFLIYDQHVADNPTGFSYPVPPKGGTAPYVIKGDTIDELTAGLSARLARLIDSGKLPATTQLDRSFAAVAKATIARFNGFARAGVDEDFARGAQLIDRSMSPHPDNGMPNRTMYPIADRGPYYAVILGAGTLDTKGGPKIDTNGRILTYGGAPIEGLYGAGNCVASLAAHAYWGAGGTIGPAIVFGYLAGKHAAARPVASA